MHPGIVIMYLRPTARSLRLGCLCLATALLSPLSISRAAEQTVLIGIRHYPRDPHISLPRFSDQDAAAMHAWLKSVAAPGVISLENETASLDRMVVELRSAILGAKAGEVVYLFISARGIALQRWKNGYIGSAGLQEEKPQSTGVPVSDLAEMIGQTRAAAVFVLADLCRDPDIDNRINERVKEMLGALPKIRGILASAPSQVSREDASLKLAPLTPAAGYGVFAYSLMSGLLAHRSRFSEVFDYVRETVRTRTSRAQQPVKFGRKDDLPLWRENRRAAAPVLLASIARGRLAFFLQQNIPGPGDASDTDEPDISEYTSLFAQERFDEVRARIRSFERTSSPSQWPLVRDRVAVAAADIGQKAIASYGMSDLLPDDPEKLGEPDFQRAERAFDTALAILATRKLTDEEERVLGAYRNSLESRRLFAKGRAAAFHNDRLTDARDLLKLAEAKLQPPIPEISNALGITYLEYPSADAAQRVRDLRTAIECFQRSIRLAPAWSYPRHNLALAHILLGDSAAAAQVYREAVAAAPHLPYLYYNLGLVLQRTNQWKDAKRAYDTALNLSAKTEGFLRQRAEDWAQNLRAEADVARKRSEVFHKNAAEMHNAMGALLESRGKHDDAAGEYELALQANARHCAARQNLAMLELHWAGKLKSAAAQKADPEELLKQNTATCPNFVPSWMSLGDLKAKEGQWEAARHAYDEATCLPTVDAEALFAIARTLEAESPAKSGAAEGYYRRALIAYEKRSAGAQPLAPPEFYLALARMEQARTGVTPCPLYRKAAEALSLLPHRSREAREVRSKEAGCPASER
jgi:tetratricopeptide (TPR) repeat protein